MMDLLHHVLKGDLVEGSRKAERRQSQQSGGNVKSIVQLYERCSVSKSIQEEGRQDLQSVMEVQRSPRHTNIQTSAKSAIPVVELPVVSPKHGALVEVAAKNPADPPPESKASSDSSTKDFRGVKRKSSSISKETIEAIESASHKIAESIDRMHTAISQVAADAVKEHDVFFHTELNYLKKRDRHVFRNQQNLISAINALTEVITTGIKKTAQAEDGSKETVGGAGAD